jgi:hypothetical protein
MFLVAAVLLLVAVVAASITVTTMWSQPKPTSVHYYNNDVQNDGISGNDYNFGPNRYAAAEEAVKNGQYATIIDYIKMDLRRSWKSDEADHGDPALTAAHALLLDYTFFAKDSNGKILQPEKSLQVYQIANAAHLRFLKVAGDYDSAVARLVDILYAENNTWEIRTLSGYTSQMYMSNNALEGNKPSVIVRNSSNVGGHELVITIRDKDGKALGEFHVRLECGYQPETTGWWNPPKDEPPVEPPVTPPTTTPEKGGNEPVPGTGGGSHKGKPGNEGNPPEETKPPVTNPVDPNTPPGGADDDGNAIAPGAGDDTNSRVIPSTQPGANPTTPGQNGQEPANSGSAGNPNDI